MLAGKLNRRITLQRKTETKSPTGAVSSAWADIATVWAEVVTVSTTEFLTGFGEADTDTIVFLIRWRDDVLTADRVSHAGEAYGIKAVVEIGRQDGLELRCEATR